jgi:CRP-like cAMP-binding protein
MDRTRAIDQDQRAALGWNVVLLGLALISIFIITFELAFVHQPRLLTSIVVGELGAFLEYREPFTARVEQPGEILALPADALASLSAESPELAHRLQRLAIQMIGSKLEKTSQTLAEP